MINLNLRTLVILSISVILFNSHTVIAQKTIKEHVEKTGADKIKKKIIKSMGSVTTFKDGHGKFPHFTSKSQFDTIALTAFYLFDNGTSKTTGNSAYNVTTNTWISEESAIYFSNKFYKMAIDKMKADFKKRGVILLTPDEYLDTDEKKEYYYNEFTAEAKGLSKIMNNQQTSGRDVEVCIPGYKCFDEFYVQMPKVIKAFGYDLAKKLNVNGTMSIGIQVSNNQKALVINGIKLNVNGINPVPKQDVKYRGASWAKYHDGLVYFSSTYSDKKGLKFATLHKRKQNITEEHPEGFDQLMSCFTIACLDKWENMIAKNTK